MYGGILNNEDAKMYCDPANTREPRNKALSDLWAESQQRFYEAGYQAGYEARKEKEIREGYGGTRVINNNMGPVSPKLADLLDAAKELRMTQHNSDPANCPIEDGDPRVTSISLRREAVKLARHKCEEVIANNGTGGTEDHTKLAVALQGVCLLLERE